jgi:tetratricopeptide (TPR) repeat protein
LPSNFLFVAFCDFFDWSSGVFEFPDKQEFIEQSYEKLIQAEYSEYLNLTPEEQTQKVLEFEMLLETEQSPERKANILLEQGKLFAAGQDMMSAIASYDQAVKFKPDYHVVWNNRGNALRDLGRFEEAVASYDQAVKFKPDYHVVWNNRGNVLRDLGRFEEAVASYDEAVKIKSDKHEAWDNRGYALHKQGKLPDAIKSYDKALEIKSDSANAWYNRAYAYGDLGDVDKAIENLQTAINLDAKYREMAKTDADFDSIRNDTRFQALLIKNMNLSHAESQSRRE